MKQAIKPFNQGRCYQNSKLVPPYKYFGGEAAILDAFTGFIREPIIFTNNFLRLGVEHFLFNI